MTEVIDSEVVEEAVSVVNGSVDGNVGMALQIYSKVAIAPFPEKVQKTLDRYQQATPENGMGERYDILPTGELYLPQHEYRRILNQAFGFGGWAIVPYEPYSAVHGKQMAQTWVLIALGQFVGQTVAGAEFQENNDRFQFSDACESLKSNAIMRLCKDLGIGGDCWDRRYVEEWRRTQAIEVWVVKWAKDRQSGSWKASVDRQYRRAAAAPVRHEIRPVGLDEKFPPKIDEKGNEIGGKKPEAEKRAPAAEKAKAPAPEVHAILGAARAAGGKAITARFHVVAVKRKKRTKAEDGKQVPYKNAAGEQLYHYTVQVLDGPELSTFSSTMATLCHDEGVKEKKLMVGKVKLTTSGDREFLNLEAVEVAAPSE